TRFSRDWSSDVYSSDLDEGQERGGARVDGAGQRLIKTAVQQVEEGFAFADPQVFPHPVKDDDGGIERVPNDREDGRDEGAVDLYAQRRNDARGDDGVVQESNDGRDGELELKPQGDVNQNPERSEGDGQECSAHELRPDDGPHKLRAQDLHAAKGAGQGRVQPLNLLAGQWTRPDKHVVGIVQRLDDGSRHVQVGQLCSGQNLPDVAGRHRPAQLPLQQSA